MRLFTLRRSGLTLGLLALVGAAIWLSWPRPLPPPDWTAQYDTAAHPPEELVPGTIVEASPPEGWSHLVITSRPRVREDQGLAFPILTRQQSVRMASWMFTAFVADVVPVDQNGKTRYHLRSVALGLGAKVNHKRIILSPERKANPPGVAIGILEEEILTKGYLIQRQAVFALHSDFIGILDTPVWFRCGDDNHLVRYRYALLVDPTTGRLDVLMWSLGAEGAKCQELTEIVRIAANTVDEPELLVDRRKVNLLGIPTDDAFAVESLPPGRRFAFPIPLRESAARMRFTSVEALELERQLRQFLREIEGSD